jgi:hypothetical protein
LAMLLRWHPIVQHDGALSVRRARIFGAASACVILPMGER